MGMTLDKKEQLLNRYMKDVFSDKKPYAFISYSHAKEDREKVYSLLIKLMDEGINFAIDVTFPDEKGDWIPIMYKGVKNKKCKCMLSFYSKTYMYSRPSLLEQYTRYATDIKQDHDGYVQSVNISLFEGGEIAPFLKASCQDAKEKIIKDAKDKVKEKFKAAGYTICDEEVLDAVMQQYKLEQGNMRDYFDTGIRGFCNEDSVRVRERLNGLGNKVDTEDDIKTVLENIQKGFLEIGQKENAFDNVNGLEKTEKIISQLKACGIDKDSEIKKKVRGIIEELQPLPVDNVGINPVQENISEDVVQKKIETEIIEEFTEEQIKQTTETSSTLKTEPTTVNTGTLWKYTGKGADALLEWEGGDSKACVVKKGSRVAQESDKFVTSAPGAAELKRELKTKGIIINNVFQEDYAFNKVSTMINLLYGGSVNMRGQIKDNKLYCVEGSVSMPATELETTEVKMAVGKSEEVTADLRHGDVSESSPAVWKYIGKGADAEVEWNGIGSKACIVRKGSRAAKESDKFATSAAGAAKLKQELEAKGIILNDVFQTDYAYDKVSTMINLLYGGSVDMHKEIKTNKLYLVSGEAVVRTQRANTGGLAGLDELL